MRKNLKGCKRLAKETLTGNFMVPVIGSIAVAAMSVISGYISTALFPGDSLYAIIGGEVFSFILSLVICVFSAGLYRIYLNISRREKYSFGDLLYYGYGKYSRCSDELGGELSAVYAAGIFAESSDSDAVCHDLLYSGG